MLVALFLVAIVVTMVAKPSVVAKGSMHPDKYRSSHPAAIPTQAQLNTINHWTKALNK